LGKELDSERNGFAEDIPIGLKSHEVTPVGGDLDTASMLVGFTDGPFLVSRRRVKVVGPGAN